MKKFLLLIVAACTLTTMGACGSSNKQGSGNEHRRADEGIDRQIS